MYQLIGLDRLHPLAEVQWQVTNTYRTAIQLWEDTRPQLVDAFVVVAGITLMSIALTYHSGVFCGRFCRRLNAAVRAAIESGRDAWIMYYQDEPAIVGPDLPDPQRFAELELLDTLIEACEDAPQTANPDEVIELPEPGDNTPLESPDQSEDQEFDPIPEIAVDDIPTAPDLRELGYLEEFTPRDVKQQRRRGRTRKEK